MPEPVKCILMLGCFDTKAEDFAFLHKCLLDQNEKVITLNVGVMGTTEKFPVDIESDQVVSQAGYLIEDLRSKANRGHAVEIMGVGAAKIVAKLVAEKTIKAAIGMGGGGGTYIALTAMQAIPFGIPKLCLSTVAAKDLSRQTGNKDITLMPSIVDIAGLNSINMLLISQAAAAICAMAKVTDVRTNISVGTIAISMFGNTSACVDQCSALLRESGFEVLAFHATGVGGRTMEALIREGCFDAVLDVTTTELADDLCGGICSAGPDRLNAAAEMGVPQLVVPGCLDMVNFAQRDTVPEQYRHRELYNWAPDVTLMRTNKEENKILAERLVQKLQRSTAAVAILLPTLGISQIDREGGVFFRPEIDQVLFESIKEHARGLVHVIEMDAHINDKTFSEKLVSVLLGMLEKKSK
jgi:uncharacterized protein (UPF0261 family)